MFTSPNSGKGRGQGREREGAQAYIVVGNLHKAIKLSHLVLLPLSLLLHSTRSGEESTASPQHPEEEHEEERRNSFAEEEDEEDLLPALALINSQQALLELIERHSEEGVEGLADLENLPGMIQADYELS